MNRLEIYIYRSQKIIGTNKKFKVLKKQCLIMQDRFFAYLKDIEIDAFVGYINYQFNKNDIELIHFMNLTYVRWDKELEVWCP